MEIVIKVPNNAFKNGICEGDTDRIVRAIVDYVGCCSAELLNILNTAIPLPKGHGALKDADEVMNAMERNFDMQELYLPIHFMQFAMDEAQTIIEADKEGNNGDSN